MGGAWAGPWPGGGEVPVPPPPRWIRPGGGGARRGCAGIGPAGRVTLASDPVSGGFAHAAHWPMIVPGRKGFIRALPWGLRRDEGLERLLEPLSRYKAVLHLKSVGLGIRDPVLLPARGDSP